MRVRISRPRFTSRATKEVDRVLRSGMISQGKEVAKLESRLARFLSVKDVVAVNSGTNALWLALVSLGVGSKDEVVVPSFSFIATANAVVYVGAKPVFADIDSQTMILSPATVEAVVSPKTKAVIMVSLYGSPAYTKEIADFCHQHNLLLIEDAAQSIGARVGNQLVGTFGVGCFSFYATKNMTTGEGGAIATNDVSQGQVLRSLRNHGNTGRDYEYDRLGYNARLTDFQAVLGQDQLSRLSRTVNARRARAKYLLKLITNPSVKLPLDIDGHSWHQFTIRSNKRDKLQLALKKHGFESKIYYPIPIHCQPLYQKLGYGGLKLLVTEQTAGEALSLPIHPKVTFKQLADMADIINQEGA